MVGGRPPIILWFSSWNSLSAKSFGGNSDSLANYLSAKWQTLEKLQVNSRCENNQMESELN